MDTKLLQFMQKQTYSGLCAVVVHVTIKYDKLSNHSGRAGRQVQFIKSTLGLKAIIVLRSSPLCYSLSQL